MMKILLTTISVLFAFALLNAKDANTSLAYDNNNPELLPKDNISLSTNDTSIAASVDTVAFSLDNCIVKVLENNYQLQIQRRRQAIADNNVSWGAAGALPTIDIVADGAGRINNDYNTLSDDSKSKETMVDNYVVGAGVNLSWSIFEGLRIYTSYQKFKEFAAMGEVETQMAIEDVVAKTVSAYYNIVRQNIRLENLEATLALTKERLDISKQRYDLEDGSLLEYQLAQVDYNSDNYEFVKQREVVRTAYIELKKLMVINVDSAIKIQESTINMLPVSMGVDFQDQVRTSNLTLKMASMQSSISNMDLKIAQSRLYPYIRLNSNYAYGSNWNNHIAVKHNHNLNFNVGLTVGINLFDGLNTRREIRNAKHQIEIDSLFRRDLENNVIGELISVQNSYINNVKLIEMEGTNIVVAKEYYKSAEMKYVLGMLSGVDFRDAQTNLLMAEERLSALQYETKLLELSLFLLNAEVTKRYVITKDNTQIVE